MTARLAGGLVLAILLAASGVRAEDPSPRDPNADWDRFCERLKEVGHEIHRGELPDSALDRAEGTRYLLQRLSASIDEVLDRETAPTMVTLFSHKLRKYGMDSADAKYATARISGDGVYKLSGRLGSAHHIAFQLVTTHDGYRAFDSISREELSLDDGGGFELLVAAERPEDWGGDFLRLDPRATELLLREYFYDWANELPSDFRIERLDAPAAAAPIDPAATRQTLEEIAAIFEATVPKWFGPSLHDRASRVNQLSAPVKSASEGIRDNAYGSGWFRLEPDEALLIELDEPEAHLWSFELGNFWWQSIDYVSHSSSLNGFQAARSSDGRYRLVISLVDPGVPNWLDPAGHREGEIIYRYQRADAENATPVARLVKLSELPGLLPADTPRVTPEQRREEIRMRQRHAARRWAP